MKRTSTRMIAATAVLVTGAAVLTGSAALAEGWVSRAQPAGDPAGTAAVLQTVALLPDISPAGRPESARAGAASPGSAGAVGETAAPQRSTRPFSLVGATWTDPRVALHGTVEVRTRSAADGTWTGWQVLQSDEPDAADPGGERGNARRGSTDPLWVGESDGVQARVTTADGRGGPLPAGLRLDLINPDENAGRADTAPAPSASRPSAAGRSPSSSPLPAVESAPAGRSAGVAYPARPVPRMISRASWGADETIVQHPPEYTTDVLAMFVHHTATGNDYTCDQSAAIVRGIEQYHVRSRGWNDIGYNFLVDKCGNLFEGRKGGADQPVLGAHTLGFNSHSSAIAVIGNYTATGVSATVRNVIAQVAAYKIGAYGNNPAGTVVLTSSGSDRYPAGTAVTLNRISGHRDTGRTECPGDALYAQLGAIRAIAGAAPTGLGLLKMAGTYQLGTTYYTRGPLRPLWTLATPSGLLARFDVLVDQTVVASLTNGGRTTLLRLTPGAHTVAVRAVHLSGRSSTVAARVVADATAPAFTMAPALRLRTGSLATSVPVRLHWSVADPGGLKAVALIRPALVDLGLASRPWPGVAAPGMAGTWTIRAADRAGNVRDASVTRTPVLVAEAAAARTGHWRTVINPVYLGGRAMFSTGAGASMTYTFTGPGLALAASQSSGSGRLRIYLDGVDKGFVDLRAASTVNRVAVWAGNWSVAGTHTAKFVLEGTAGRAEVIMDGIVVLR